MNGRGSCAPGGAPQFAVTRQTRCRSLCELTSPAGGARLGRLAWRAGPALWPEHHVGLPGDRTREASTSIPLVLQATATCVTHCHVTGRNAHTRAPLTDLQQAILDVVWAEGGVTAERVREALKPRFPLKDSSVRTLLRRLEQRGLLSHTVDGKVFVYRAEVRARSVAARSVRHLIERFCHGSAEQFLLGMVDEKVLTAEEIQKLAKKIGRQK
jgi:BlaI family penicillinase repressor